VGVLCIKRTLSEGRAYGFASGLGAATADTFYGAIAGFGVAFISNFLISNQDWLRVLGGILLCYIGFRTFRTIPVPDTVAPTNSQKGLISAYLSIFFVTIMNPMTIFCFAAVFAAVGLGNIRHNYLTGWLLVLGVFTGSAVWWLLLSGIVDRFRGKFEAGGLYWINRVSGLILMGFGVLALLPF
jgi:threonine/homoserine/homoserine lactone efflux protein